MNKSLEYVCSHSLQDGSELTECQKNKKINFYKTRYGICCYCKNFMPEDFECVESNIIPLKERSPMITCSDFEEDK